MSEGARRRRKRLEGVVLSDRMAKTIVVRVERLAPHPKYGKVMRLRTRLYAHDPEESARAGDRVEVASTRPLSRLKRWRLVRVLSRAPERLVPEAREVGAVPGALVREDAPSASGPEAPEASGGGGT